MNLSDLKVPTIISGGKATDDRGSLTFNNGIELNQFKRFYAIENHRQGFIRAWHGHLKEAKLFVPLRGSFLVAAVELDDPVSPSKDNKIAKSVISDTNSNSLFIPAGFANGFMNLSADAILLVYSTTSLDESKGDDYRFEFDYWNPWEIEQR
jgi:dTDP-4-dehydrorhamnose 3,5-epimerase-like enzyme